MVWLRCHIEGLRKGKVIVGTSIGRRAWLGRKCGDFAQAVCRRDIIDWSIVRGWSIMERCSVFVVGSVVGGSLIADADGECGQRSNDSSVYLW